MHLDVSLFYYHPTLILNGTQYFIMGKEKIILTKTNNDPSSNKIFCLKSRDTSSLYRYQLKHLQDFSGP